MIETLKAITENFILDYGYLGMFIITLTEQFIFPLPADIFLGFSVENGLDYSNLMWLVFLATILGSLIGYYLGKYLGHPVLTWLVGKTKVDKGEAFMRKWGVWSVIVAGITPIPFKIITWMAGIFEMPMGRYLIGVIVGRMPRYLLATYVGMRFFESKFYASEEMAAIILGGVQGITEFLPISSSGHLVVVEHLIELPIPASQLATFDIFLHGGSLFAIVLYFWKDWVQVFKEFWKMITTFKVDYDSTFFKLAVATIPAIIAGLAFGDYIAEKFRGLTSIAILFMVVGVLYFYTAWKGKKAHIESVGLKKAVFIGIAQAVALLPGVSRAGSTISTGVALGIKPEVAARFSFMLGAVAILAANVYTLLTLDGAAALPGLTFLLTGTITAFVCSLVAIYFLMRFLQKRSLRAFGVYLILVGGLILGFM